MADGESVRIKPTVGVPYLKSYQGIIKEAEILFSGIALTLTLFSTNETLRHQFLAATVGTIVTSLFIIFIYFTRIVKKSWRIWIKIELNFAFVWSIFLFFSSLFVYFTNDLLYSSAGLLGILASVCFFADGFHKFDLDGKV